MTMDAPFSKVFVLDNTSIPTSNNVAVNNVCFVNQQRMTSPTKLVASPEDTSNEYLTANEKSFNIAANNLAAKNPKLQKVFRTLKRLLQRKQTEMSTVTSTTGPTTMAARKQMGSAEQGEPAKPLSAYALFFRDTVSAIKQQNPTCSFQELSKIVASMWDILDPVHKDVYNKKNELARVEYLKQMRIYQQQQLEKQEQLNANANEATQNDSNGQQQQKAVQQDTQPIANNSNIQQNIQQVNSNQVTSSNAQATANSGNSGGPTDDSMRPPNEVGEVQKCTRENCNKPAIINPDWEDEYCSNECVIIHCRNVFNDWVQSNLEARRQQQQQQHMNAV